MIQASCFLGKHCLVFSSIFSPSFTLVIRSSCQCVAEVSAAGACPCAVCADRVLCAADPLEGTLVLLPAEAQRRLVQLVYFLPCLPSSLLACLSRCCIMGRMSSDLAATLIGILHMRYRALRSALARNGPGREYLVMKCELGDRFALGESVQRAGTDGVVGLLLWLCLYSAWFSTVRVEKIMQLFRLKKTFKT